MKKQITLTAAIVWLAIRIILFVSLLVLFSCKPQPTWINEEINCDVYEGVRNFYKLDTTPLIMQIGKAAGHSSYVVYEKDTICDIRQKWAGRDTLIHFSNKDNIEATAEKWDLICPQPGQPFYWLEQTYYLKNGKRILPTTDYPKNEVK